MKTQAHLIILALVLILAAAPASAQSRSLELDHVDLPAIARTLVKGGKLQLVGVDLQLGKSETAFELERFEVFTPNARIVVHGEGGDSSLEIPNNVYLRGTIVGEPRSRVFLSVLESGGMRGIATNGGNYWIMSAETDGLKSATGLQLRRIDAETELAAKTNQFACGNDSLTERLPASGLGADLPNHLEADFAETAMPVPLSATKAGAAFTARVAVETDYEFFTRFGNATAATDYVGDLFAFMSGVYADEVETTLLVSHLSLWSSPADPWSQSSPSCGLFEFGRYWNDNRGGQFRTIAHFLSGKNNGGGVAWVGVLCAGGFLSYGGASAGCPGLTPDIDNYGGAYGYTGGISGSFDINNPSAVWDFVAASHEIGHNFDSPHSHCYGGNGPVDQCYSGQCGSGNCYCGPTSLPSPPGSGGGTIMSYCHLQSGGLSNIALTLGQNHPFGNDAGRIPGRMRDHVAQMAAASPSCLALETPGMVFEDSFENGNLGRWVVHN